MRWLCSPASCHDSAFHAMIERFHDQMIVLTDQDFHETVFSLLANVVKLKKMKLKKTTKQMLDRLARTLSLCRGCLQPLHHVEHKRQA